jgi:SAM-dependent methyltransferase
MMLSDYPPDLLDTATPEGDRDIELPSEALMIAVAGHGDKAEFDRSRRAGAEQLQDDLATAGIDVSLLRDVLDFGCGCGRLLAGWAINGHAFRLHGCDYNPRLVDWCNVHIPGVTAKKNKIGAPIPYDDESLDLIYLLSVFTHLTLAEQQRLIGEFHRALRPGGYVYVTFHGEYFYPAIFAQLANGESEFRRNGFLINHAHREGTNICWTLHTLENLIRLHRGFIPLKHFTSIARGPTDVASWQDSLILQRI